ncbi:protein S40-5-like [Phaseolus vulgaris]|uniref:Senescence regulator n=1 Tax=Phaseolus vulgaris TaxID=3885 RepID=V7BRQ1_PHAVU|nr:hypothetical protein PHAVU_006G150000g [Phaseolus vulgaris]ESW19725.1 hypothetical protein PHAVU_006G150000g [Phaseolus vulgaris]
MKLRTNIIYTEEVAPMCPPAQALEQWIRKSCAKKIVRNYYRQPLPIKFSAAAQLIPPPHMAKGRKLTTSRSERFLGTYEYVNSRGSAAVEPSELREEDIWSTGDDSGEVEWEQHVSSGSNGGDHQRRIPRDREDHRRVGGLSLAFEAPASGSSQRIVHQYRAREEMAATPRGRHVATSAPVNVPDWSKILRVDSVESMNDEEEDDESEMEPPHEYLARSQKMVANSVFEGVGRTLKGRDLSRVRDAVWSQTGFDG